MDCDKCGGEGQLCDVCGDGLRGAYVECDACGGAFCTPPNPEWFTAEEITGWEQENGKPFNNCKPGHKCAP
jgi:hypothetical protein